MPSVTIRNLPDEVHRALRMRATQHGCSVEAEIRAILDAAVRPENRVGLGSALTRIGRELHLTDAEVDALQERRDASPARSADFG